jgi:osmotically-inducible protein OsmY
MIFLTASAIPADAKKKAETAAADDNADNTAKNKRDRNDSEVTADQQKNNKSDLEVTAEIRKSIMADKSLSTYAHNVKIIAENGVVTLKGPVRSEAEKSAVEKKAVDAVGRANVKCEIEIKP